MIELQCFSKAYGIARERFAVRDVSLTAPDGEITGLIGRNGAGKTTVLNAVSALHYASSGTVRVDSLNPEEEAEALFRAIGFVPEYDRLPASLTAGEFLDGVAMLHGLSGERKKAAFFQTVRDCALSDVLQKKIAALSKGFRRRLSFAASLIHNPKNLILDEPFSGLDPAQTAHFRSLIKNAASDRAVLLSTHSLPEAAALCSKIYILADGSVAAEGTAEALTAQYGVSSLEEAFVKITGDAHRSS